MTPARPQSGHVQDGAWIVLQRALGPKIFVSTGSKSRRGKKSRVVRFQSALFGTKNSDLANIKRTIVTATIELG